MNEKDVSPNMKLFKIPRTRCRRYKITDYGEETSGVWSGLDDSDETILKTCKARGKKKDTKKILTAKTSS